MTEIVCSAAVVAIGPIAYFLGMAPRKNAKRTNAARPSKSPGHNQLRREIRKADRELIRVISDRAKLVRQLAKSLTSPKSGPAELASDLETLNQLVARYNGAFPVDSMKAILRELYNGSIAMVEPPSVAYLGPPYSYSHLAAQAHFGSSGNLVPVGTIAAVFEEVVTGNSCWGLAPIENSTDGRVVDTLDMFARVPLKICAEVQLRVHHNLLGQYDTNDQTIDEVYSKPQALSQCRAWLARHFPRAKKIETPSTAEAALKASKKHRAAAIASRPAAAAYGLDVLAAHIEDNPNNVTRFAVLGKEIPDRTGNDKTVLMFALPHRDGTLADATAIFKRCRLNLTWIESFPMRDVQNEYLFIVEFEGHPDDTRSKRALESLKKKTVRLDILGAYARTDPVE